MIIITMDRIYTVALGSDRASINKKMRSINKNMPNGKFFLLQTAGSFDSARRRIDSEKSREEKKTSNENFNALILQIYLRSIALNFDLSFSSSVGRFFRSLFYFFSSRSSFSTCFFLSSPSKTFKIVQLL